MSTKVTAEDLAHDVAEFLAFKRAMGMGYRRAEFDLNSFVRSVHDRHGERLAPLEEAVTLWATRAGERKAISVGNESDVVRHLCLFRSRSDPRTFVPEHAVAPARKSVFVPYMFSHEEVLALVDAASRHGGRNLCGAMSRAFTLVLYGTGMRLGEATQLGMEDTNLRRGIPTVQRSKRRSRILPVRDDLVAKLRQYLRHREDVLASTGVGTSTALLVRRNGSALTLHAASNGLRRLLRDLGLKPASGRCVARPYEFRHTFAVHRLTAWAVEGVDVHAPLPLLSAYLGHLNVLGTEVHLEATPQLLELASQRFEQHSLGRRREP